MNEDKIRQQECETYLDNAICEKSQEERIKELEAAIDWLAIELADRDVDTGSYPTFYDTFRDPEVRKTIESIPTLIKVLRVIFK